MLIFPGGSDVLTADCNHYTGTLVSEIVSRFRENRGRMLNGNGHHPEGTRPFYWWAVTGTEARSTG